MKRQSKRKHKESTDHVIMQVTFFKYSPTNWKRGIPKCDFQTVHLCVCSGTVSWCQCRHSPCIDHGKGSGKLSSAYFVASQDSEGRTHRKIAKSCGYYATVVTFHTTKICLLDF